MRAYELKNYQIAGPAWLDSERYEIAAKIPAGAGKSEVALMLRTLLAERFRLVAHRETRELPIYAMVVAKNGPKFQGSPAASRNATSAADDGDLPRGSVPKLTRGRMASPTSPAGRTFPAATRLS